jgi:hypothetical protein
VSARASRPRRGKTKVARKRASGEPVASAASIRSVLATWPEPASTKAAAA